MSTGYKLRKIFRVGYCIGRGAHAQRGLSLAKVRFYARAFLLEHPARGLILIDTGYGKTFADLTKKGVGRLYPLLLKMVYDPKESLLLQLEKEGISQKELSYLVLTHFHPDHVGGLSDFTEVSWIYRSDMLSALTKQPLWKQLKGGFFRGLVPAVPQDSLTIKEDDFSENWEGFSSCDVFGDRSLRLIDLPGHALGQMGVLIGGQLFAADAIWSLDAPPSAIGMLAQHDPKAYKQTYEKLSRLSSSVDMIPTHTIEPNE